MRTISPVLSLLGTSTLAIFIAACSDGANPSNLIGPGYYGGSQDNATAGGSGGGEPAGSASGGSADGGAGATGSGDTTSGGGDTDAGGSTDAGAAAATDAGMIDAGTTDAGTKSSDGGSPSMDSGTTTTTTDVFTNAGAFTSQVASSTHNAGLNCMGGCHNHGFTFAGTLTDGKGNGVAGAEVRLVDANGQAISVYTGPTGNFHSSTGWTAPAKVGARNATNKVLMTTSLGASNGGCNGCHATGATVAPIHIP